MRPRIAFPVISFFCGVLAAPPLSALPQASPDTLLLAEETYGTTTYRTAAGPAEVSTTHYALMGAHMIRPDSLHAWYEELDISRFGPDGYEFAATEAVLYDPFIVIIDSRGQGSARRHPKIPPEVAELSDLARQFDDYFPPPVPDGAGPGDQWTDTLRISASSGGDRYELERIGVYEVQGHVEGPTIPTDPESERTSFFAITESASYRLVSRSLGPTGAPTDLRVSGRYDGWYTVPPGGGMFEQRERDYVLTGTVKYVAADIPVTVAIEQRFQNWSASYTRDEYEEILAASNSEDVVATTFWWPIGTEARVDATERHVQRIDDLTRETVVTSTFAMSVESHPQGLRIRHSDIDILEMRKPPALDETEQRPTLAETLSTYRPNLIVSESGLLLEIEGLADMMAQARDLYAPMIDSLFTGQGLEQGAEEPQFLNFVMEGGQIREQIVDRWDTLVDAWSNTEFSIGQTIAGEVQIPSPVAAGVTIPLAIELTLTGRVPCLEGDTTNECIEFIMSAVADEERALAALREAFAQMAEALGESMGDPESDLPFRALGFEQEARVITRPESMLPSRVESTKTISQTIEVDGELTEWETVVGFVYVFHYDS